MQIKMKTVIVVRFILILSSVFFFGCKKNSQQKKNYEWSAAMSRPAYYVGEGFHVFYLRNGEIIGSTATLTHIPGNWSRWQSARSSNYSGLLPDSVVVDYGGLNDKLEMCTYRGGMSLPIEELKKMFKEGYVDQKGERKDFKYITTGMAPGGRICVWVDHIEIKRGIVQQKDIYCPYPVIISSKDSRKQDSIEINNFLKHHPVDYFVWEKPDPRYELDFGFCSEGNLSEFSFIYSISKEGIRNVVFKERIDQTLWDIPFGKMNDLKADSYQQINESYSRTKKQLPVEIQIGWKNNKQQSYYTYVVLPKDFPKRFIRSYINPKTAEEDNFNRLVFGVEKDGEHCIIWLDGPDKQEKLMRFKGIPSKKDEKGVPLNKGTYATEVVYFD